MLSQQDTKHRKRGNKNDTMIFHIKKGCQKIKRGTTNECKELFTKLRKPCGKV